MIRGGNAALAAALCAALHAPLQAQSPGVAPEVPAVPAAALVMRPDVSGLEPYEPLGARADVQARGRYTRRGALIGGAVGALGGLGFGVLVSLFCGAETGEDCTGAIPILTLLGAGAGAAAGAIIGAAIPRRAGPAAAEAPDTAAAAPAAPAAARGRIGSASLSAGLAGSRGGSESAGEARDWRVGPAFRFNFFAELGDWFALGPQLGLADLEAGWGVRHAALAARASRPGRRFSPYVVADLGVYQVRLEQQEFGFTGTTEFLGGSLGAGTRIFPFSSPRTFLDVDARWHRHAQNIAPFDMTAVSVGLGRVW